MDLSQNNIVRVPDGMLCPLHSLEYLNLTQNRLHDVISFHFSASLSTRASKKCGKSIKILDFSNNNIDNLPAAIFSGLDKLTNLYLDSNKMNFIADRALEGLLSLSVINLANNLLSTLPPELFNEARNVQQIYLQNNTINVLAPDVFSELSELVVLDLSKNILTAEWVNSRTFKGLAKLVYLDLSNNHIEKLEPAIFKDTLNLNILKLQDNQIEHIPETVLSGLSRLETLTLSNNFLMSIGESIFQDLVNLKLLSLDYNRIVKIHTSAFKNNTKVEDLNLNGNKLDRIPSALENLFQLRYLDIGENLIKNLKKSSLKFGLVSGLRMVGNLIEELEQGTFDYMEDLQILNLSNNRIRRIESGTFDNNTNLQAIRLDANLLTDITGLFTNLPKLVWLNISENKLNFFDYSMIPANLQWLDIHANKIKELGNYFEIDTHLSLSTIDASANLLTEITGSSIPNSVEVLTLTDNLIAKVQSYTFFKKPNITKVDLFGNKLTTLDPNSLRISAVPETKPMPEFFIGGNPFECDCNLDWLQKNNSGSRTQPVLKDVASIYCKLLYNRGKSYVPLVEASPNQFLCKYESHCGALCHCCDFLACDCKMGCPKNCKCYHDLSWTSIVVDCSNVNYENQLPDQIPIDATQIYLDGNVFRQINSHAFIGRRKLKILFLNNSNIEIIQNRTFNGLINLEYLDLGANKLTELIGHEFHGLDNLKELYLHQNRIQYIDNTTFIELYRLKMLRLDHNRIKTMIFWNLPANLIDVRLSENPWSCDCESIEDFQDFLQQHHFVKDEQKLRCLGNNEQSEGFFIGNNHNQSGNLCVNFVGLQEDLVNANNKSLTKTLILTQSTQDYITILIAVLSIFLIAIIGIVFVFIFRQEMRVWFHSRFGVRLFYDNNIDMDKNERDKMFDAFISYSSKDEAFVVDELAPALESGTTRYMLCLHYRDFPVGAYIADTIVQAIESSRRTIMVLSENFIKSEWCRFEFKQAHHQVLRDRRRRLIIILLGDVPQKDLDPDLRLYLKTNTYLQWGDKFFWDKLRFALPDVPNNRQPQNNDANINHSRLNMCHHNLNIRNSQRNIQNSNLIQMNQIQSSTTSGGGSSTARPQP